MQLSLHAKSSNYSSFHSTGLFGFYNSISNANNLFFLLPSTNGGLPPFVLRNCLFCNKSVTVFNANFFVCTLYLGRKTRFSASLPVYTMHSFIFTFCQCRWPSRISYLGFGGGVLLCTTFLHLLPEVAETFEELNYTPDMEIHYAELLMCVGFFVMYFVEECVHVYLHQ